MKRVLLALTLCACGNAAVAGHWYSLLNRECTGIEADATCAIGTLELTKLVNPDEKVGLRFVFPTDR